MKTPDTTNQPQKKEEAGSPAVTGSALYRAAVSGLWYDNPAAAGTVTAVICKHCRDGVERNPGESMTFMHRVADFWKDHQADPCHVQSASAELPPPSGSASTQGAVGG